MSKEEINQYCAENEPSEVKRDKVERWEQRIWLLPNSQIVESYQYKYDADVVAENTDPTMYRDAFAVLTVNREEVANG